MDLDKLNESLQKPPAPIMDGLITDPIPGRVRKLEELVVSMEKRITILEERTHPSEIRRIASS
jgi:hypothetical protein